ncbi:MAG: glycosyltransferase family 4 protein [Nitrospirota bacterium]
MKRRVVQIITRLELGGAQQVALYTARNLPRSLYDVTLIAGGEDILSADARAVPELHFIEMPELVREISPLYDLKALIGLCRMLRKLVKESPEGVIVHTHSSKAGILGRLAARIAGARVIVHTIHGYGFNDEQGWLRRRLFITLEKIASRCTDRFIAVAFNNIAKGSANGIFEEDRAVVIRCGIDMDYFKSTPTDPQKKRDELGLPPGAPVVTMVSCLKPQKAPVDFVRVAASVLESVPGAHFVQAGDGELKDEVLKEAGRLGIEKNFHLIGWRDDVRDIIHISDIVVLTSLWEGLPIVLMQAMAAGKPIVATAVDGTPEAVKDGVNGFLARPHDIDGMAEKVVLLLSDKGLANKMGSAGKGLASEFDEKKMLQDICTLYERLLKEAV